MQLRCSDQWKTALVSLYPTENILAYFFTSASLPSPPQKNQKENQNLILLAQMCSRTRYSRKLERLISDGKISKVIVFVLLFFFPPATEIGYMLQNLIKDINLDSKVRKAMECRQVLENAFK